MKEHPWHTRQNVNHPPDRNAINAVCPHPAYNAWIPRTTRRGGEGLVGVTGLFSLKKNRRFHDGDHQHA